jgi:putative acetyltransferase
MLVRRELGGDEAAIRAITAAAFARPGEGVPVEAPLVDWLRANPAWIPELSFVAVDSGGDLAGHVVCTRGAVGTAAVLALGESLVALLGSTTYYPRFGFRLASEHGITPQRPEWEEHFQVRTFTAYDPALCGEFAYPEPFDRT